MPSPLEDAQGSGLVIEVLYVEHCPNFPAALTLVQRVAAELGIDVQVRTTMIGDQAAADDFNPRQRRGGVEDPERGVVEIATRDEPLVRLVDRPQRPATGAQQFQLTVAIAGLAQARDGHAEEGAGRTTCWSPHGRATGSPG